MSDERPDLAAVLEHYGVHVPSSRVTAMVACPLHEDQTPSCSINLDKQLWRCHSCGEAGSSYDLIMKKEDTDFVGARAFASAQHFAAGSGGGSDSELSGSAYGGRRKVPDRSRNQPRGGGYTPTWRRR